MSGSSSEDKRPSRVLDHLFIGSRVHAKNRGLLKELGINRILNVTPPRTMDPTNGVPNFFEKDRSMTYKRVAVFDNRGEDLLQHLESCISFIEQGSFYGKVLVHCNKGVSRSSTVVAAYLMRTRGLSKTAAMAYLRSRRSIVNPHEGFMAQLEAFDVKLNGEREAAIADGQEKKFPDDLLGRKAAQGPAIGPIGPPRGPSGPTTAPPNSSSRSTSPIRRPASGPSPPRIKGAEKGPAGRGRGASKSPPRGPIGPSRGPEPAPPPTLPSPAATADGDAGAAVGPRPRPADDAGGPKNGASDGASCKELATPDREGSAGAEVATAATAAANGSASNEPTAETSAIASIGPAMGPPAAAHAPVAAGDASTESGGVAGAQGASVSESSDAGGGDSSGAGVGEKRPRQGEDASDLAEAVVQKARVAVSGGAGQG